MLCRYLIQQLSYNTPIIKYVKRITKACLVESGTKRETPSWHLRREPSLISRDALELKLGVWRGCLMVLYLPLDKEEGD